MKRIFLLSLLVLSSVVTFAQSYGNFRQLRFFTIVTAADTAATVANSGRVWYDFNTDKFRCNVNGTNTFLVSGSGGSTYTAGTGLTLTGTTFSLGGSSLFINNSTLQEPTTKSLFIGENAGSLFFAGTQGYANTGVGSEVFKVLQSGVASRGSSNTGFGYQAGVALTTGSFNTLIGTVAGSALTTQDNNTFAGYHSGVTSTGANNTALGYNSLRVTSASFLTALGTNALTANSTGTFNTAVGYNALVSNTQGSKNTTVGYANSVNTTTQEELTIMGYLAGNTQTGSYNTLIGSSSGKVMSGSSNTCIGRESFVAMGAGTRNVAIGNNAGQATTAGNDNVYIGERVVTAKTSGNSNIVIGANISTSTGTASNELNIGGIITGTGTYTASTATIAMLGKTTFTPDATDAGINVGSLAGDPSTPIAGDIWNNSSSSTLKLAQQNFALGTTLAGSNRNISAEGFSSDISLTLTAKGSSGIIASTTSGIDALTIGGSSNAGAVQRIVSNGSASNVDVGLKAKGVGLIRFYNSSFNNNFQVDIASEDAITIKPVDGITSVSENGKTLTVSGSTATGTDKPGGGLTLTTGAPTGTGTPADIVLETRNSTGTLKINGGANEQCGMAVLVGGTVVVNNTKITANSIILLTSQADGGTPGFVRISARSAGTSFTILSSSGTDTSTIGWLIIEPN